MSGEYINALDKVSLPAALFIIIIIININI